MRNAFAPIVRARPCPIFGRPVRLRGGPHLTTARYFSSCPSDSRSLRTPCPPGYSEQLAPGPPWPVSGFRLRARLGFSIPVCSPGQRGVTPAFGYGAPHPSAEGTSTPLTHALPSAHYGQVRLLWAAHRRLRPPAFPARSSQNSARTVQRSPGSRAEGVCACQGLRRRGADPCLAIATRAVLPSAGRKASAPRSWFSPLNGWPALSPANASLRSSRDAAHDSGSVRFATPSPQRTFTSYLLPVSRRSRPHGVIAERSPRGSSGWQWKLAAVPR